MVSPLQDHRVPGATAIHAGHAPPVLPAQPLDQPEDQPTAGQATGHLLPQVGVGEEGAFYSDHSAITKDQWWAKL